ncbi:MAG: protein kinase [Deltaproteobacteria bacterium]|nr:protein kinase [Deltaproteobacteria bacterium]
MKASEDILRGELERLFSSAQLKDLCRDYLDLNAEAKGLYDDAKAVFVRKLLAWCEQEAAVEALADAVMLLKKGMVDPRLKQVYQSRFADDLAAGVKAGEYLVVGPSGAGPLSVVYRCKPTTGDAPAEGLFLSVVRADHSLDRNAVQRFATMMRVLRTVDSPAVERVVAVGRLDDGRPFVVTRGIDGTPLSELKPLSVLKALPLFTAVMDALDVLHERGMVHADLRPENVVVRKVVEGSDAPPKVTLTGLGADKLFHRAEPDVAPAGPVPGFGMARGIAPEQARGGQPDVRSDIYALGALMYEVLAGKPPFAGRTAIDVVAAHLTQAPPVPGKAIDEPVPAELDSLIARMMAKDPLQRPKNLDDVRKILGDVQRVAEQLAVRAAQAGTREDLETWAESLLENPGDAEILTELKGDARKFNAWGAAVEIMEEAALASDDAAVVRRLLLEAADCAVRYLRDYGKADSIYSQFLEKDPADAEVNEALLRLLKSSGRFAELIEKLVAKAESIAEPEPKMAVIREIAAVYQDDLKEYGKAFDYLVASMMGPGLDEVLVKRLETLAEKTGRFTDLATACTATAQACEATGVADMAVLLFQRVGLCYLERLGEPNFALTCFQKVLERRPKDVEALLAVADLYRRAQQWTELAETIVRLAEAEPSPARSRDRLVEAAKLYYEKLSDSDEAHKLLKDVLAEDPGHDGAAVLLERILEKAEAWPKLAKLLSDRMGAIPEGEAVAAARYRLGELYEDRLDDLKSAKEQYERALAIDPRHLDSIKGVERICARTGDSAGLKNNLQVQLEMAVTPRQRVMLLERLAEINEEEFRDYEAAIGQYRAIFDIDKEHGSALIALTRLFRRTERWEELVELLARRAELTENEDETKDLLRERADVLKDKIGDKQRASVAFAAMASLGADDALDTLARTQEEAGDFAAAAETIRKIVAASQDPGVKVAQLARMAHIQLENLQDVAAAAATLRQALDIAPGDRSLLTEARGVFIVQGNYAGALDTLEKEIELVEGKLARAELYSAMGVICRTYIKDDERALQFFERALELDENNIMAGDILSGMYRERGLWEKALPIYQKHADAATSLEREKQIELFTMLGEAYNHLGRQDEAIKVLAKAEELAGDEAGLTKRLGEIALEHGQHALAKEQLDKYLKVAGDTLRAEEKVALFVKLGRANLGAGDAAEAGRLARQATVMAPDNNEARMLLAEVHEQRGDFRGMVEACQRVLASMPKDDPRKPELQRRAASVLFEKLKDADGAAHLLKDSLEGNPGDRGILNDLLKIYSATKRFADVVEVVLRIADLIDDPLQMARYHLTVAKIYRRELKKTSEAVTYFEMALEQDPTLKDAEESLVEIFTESKEWDKLEKHYKKAIARLPKDAPTEAKLELYKPLRELIATRFDRPKDTVLLTEAIAKLDSDNVEWQEKLAELYGWQSEHATKALSLHRHLIERNPARIDSFRMLYRIFSHEEKPDGAWCAASMLALLNQASPDERKFYRDCQPDDIPTLESRLKTEHWQKLVCHPDMNQTISSIFAVIGDAIFKVRAQDPSRFGLDPKTRMDVHKDSSNVAQLVNFAAGALDVEPPALYIHEGQGNGFQLVDTRPPSLVAGKTTAALKDRMGLAFNLGQQLTLLRPGLYIRKLVTSGTELSAWLLASVKSFVPTLPVPAELAGPVSEKLAPLREALDTPAWERLQGHVQAFVSQASDVNLKKWARAVDATSDRAGLLLCGDVSVAVRVLKEQLGTDKALLAERLRALTLFVVSEEHGKLRQHLGIALKNS